MSAARLLCAAAIGVAFGATLPPAGAVPRPPIAPAPVVPVPVGPVPAEPPLPPPRPADLDRQPEVQGPPMPPRKAPPAPASTPAPAPVPAPPPAASTTPPADCSTQLRTAGVVFEAAALGRQPEAACVVAEPVKLTGLNPPSGLPVDFPDRPTVACATALVFADYVRSLLVPLTRGQFGSAITAIGTGPGFECRTRDHIPGAKLSAHGLGLAVDIAAITLSNGRTLAIGAPKDDGERSFDRAARAGACGFFHTALGPGADAFHETHWHFDLQPRGKSGDSRICQ